MRTIVLLLLGLAAVLPVPTPSWAISLPLTMECEGRVLYVMAGENALHTRPSFWARAEDLDPGLQVCVTATRRRFLGEWYRVVTEHGVQGWIRASRLGTQQAYLASLPTSTPPPAQATSTPVQATSTPAQTPIPAQATPTPVQAAPPPAPTATPQVDSTSSDAGAADSCTDAWGTSSTGYRIRSGPGTSFAPTGQLVLRGEKVCLLAETGDWVHLRKKDGATGYTHRDGITYQPPADPSASVPPAESEPPALATEASTYHTRLAALAVAPHTHLDTYDRDDWGGSWSDADRDCQNTRHEVLQLESQGSVTFTNTRRCNVATGLWTGPWSGETFTRASDLDIDHHVPLKNAHISGGATWSPAQKRAYYNDMALEPALQAMKNSLNRTKGASGPETWKPPLPSTWCRYARDWVDVKTKYSLSITQAEKSALHSMLDTCGNAAVLPTAVRAVVVAPTLTPTPLPAPLPTSVTAPGGNVALMSCQVREEIVTFTNTSSQAVDLTGYVIHDEGAKFTYTFAAGFVIAPGATWKLISGPDGVADASRNELLFANRAIWNNSGDTAYLKQGNTLIDSLVCQ